MSLPHAILGILNMRPMTGYDLNRFFKDSINFFWSAQMSQIYRELKSLESKGMVTVREEPGDKGPNKKIYSITDNGVSCLKEWLMNEPDKIDEDNRNAFLLRVMLLSNLGTEELYLQIKNRLKKYKSDLKELMEVQEKIPYYLEMTGNKDQLPYWKITLSRGYHDVKSHIAWAEESLEELKKILRKEL